MDERGWWSSAIAAVVVAAALTAGDIISQQNSQAERVAAAEADVAAVSAAQAELTAAIEDYASAVLAASTDAWVYQEILARVNPSGIFDAAAVAEYESAVEEFTAATPGPGDGADLAQWEGALRADPALTLALEQPTVSGLSAEEVTGADSSGGDEYETGRATVTGDVTALTEAADSVASARAELEAAEAKVAEATARVTVATTLSPNAVVAELSLASDESKLAFTAAHDSVTALDSTAGAQAALHAITAYLDSYAAVRASNETIAAERAAEEERIRRESLGRDHHCLHRLHDLRHQRPVHLCPPGACTRRRSISATGRIALPGRTRHRSSTSGPTPSTAAL